MGRVQNRIAGACLAAASVLPHRQATATPRATALTPATTSIGLTVYAMGLFPVPGSFAAFHGTLQTDPEQPGFCHVEIVVDQASLHMSDPARARRALAPDMLDAGRYPTMRYSGSCEKGGFAGQLTLHGLTHPLALTIAHRGTPPTATIEGKGQLTRGDYAIDGMRHLIGETIQIRFSTMAQPP